MSWAGRSAVEIAEAVRRGEVSAVAVVQDHLDAVAERDGRIGAFRRVREQALDEARAVQKRADLEDLPLAGVPVAVKDNLEVAGEAPRNGSRAGAGEPAREDHPVVARLRAAGAVVLGLTNVPELCLVGVGDSVYGTVRNPWQPERTAGGSSSGSAAAVAAGMAPIAVGNDGMGSLRIPAAACGVLAIKPGPRLVPPPAHAWRGLSENGPIATTVADLALALSVIAADPDLAESWQYGRRTEPAPRPLRSVWDESDDYAFRAPRERPASPEPFDLRVAAAPQPLPPGLHVDAEFQAAVRAAVDTLRMAGHTAVEHGRRLPVWLGPATVAAWLACAADDAAGLDRRLLEPRTRSMARAGWLLNRLKLDGSRGRARWRDGAAETWFGDADVVATPTVALLPPPARRWGSRGLLRNLALNVRFAPATGPWNMCGWPAITVPFATHSTGLPIGVQLVAPPGGEPQLLGLAAQLESARPWPRHAPGYG
ncbi:amidase [Thermoactinospora rubra]|uniref:amidase n=1 Tax=Thermoactinospora rubra TaxID=1088767 RepID=UPI000A11C4DB|nr:amidase [Thermoactinospora rubra]